MTQRDNGGPAFPVADDVAGSNSGMTLRDWFAGHCPPMTEQWFEDSPAGTHWNEAYAAWAYHYADAMMAERAKP